MILDEKIIWGISDNYEVLYRLTIEEFLNKYSLDIFLNRTTVENDIDFFLVIKNKIYLLEDCILHYRNTPGGIQMIGAKKKKIYTNLYSVLKNYDEEMFKEFIKEWSEYGSFDKYYKIEIDYKEYTKLIFNDNLEALQGA